MRTLLFILGAAVVPLVLGTSQGWAQAEAPAPLSVGDPFPRLEGEFLTGRKAVLPEAAEGRLALVLMGFTYNSRFQVEAWAEEVKPGLVARDDATFYEVPVIGGMARLGKWFIDSGMRRGTPRELHENVITVWGGVDRWKRLMGFSPRAEHDAYVALIGGDGRVRWLHRGPPSEAALEALTTAAGGGSSQAF
jgi:hypothetical protein